MLKHHKAGSGNKMIIKYTANIYQHSSPISLQPLSSHWQSCRYDWPIQYLGHVKVVKSYYDNWRIGLSHVEDACEKNLKSKSVEKTKPFTKIWWLVNSETVCAITVNVLQNIVEVRQALGDNGAAHGWRREVTMKQPGGGCRTCVYPPVQHTPCRHQQLLCRPLVYCCLWYANSLSKCYPMSTYNNQY